jgi:hypothetical protein
MKKRVAAKKTRTRKSGVSVERLAALLAWLYQGEEPRDLHMTKIAELDAFARDEYFTARGAEWKEASRKFARLLTAPPASEASIAAVQREWRGEERGAA